MGMFTKATKAKAFLRLALTGPAGSGKTWTALEIARHLLPEGGKIALIDSEHGSASKYADVFDFCVVELTDHHPERFIEAIKAAQAEGFDLLIIDSLTHAWDGHNGILEQVDRAKNNPKNRNEFAAWGQLTPLHNKLIDSMLGSKLHIIATMRSKMEYVIENVDGRNRPVKVGVKPIQRDGVEYEFDIVGDLDVGNNMSITKTRCSALQGANFHKAGGEVATAIREWLDAGTGERKASKVVEPTTSTKRNQPYPPETLAEKYAAALDYAKTKMGDAGDDRRPTIIKYLASESGLDEAAIKAFVKALCGIEVISVDMTIHMANVLYRLANAEQEVLAKDIVDYLAFVAKPAKPVVEETQETVSDPEAAEEAALIS